MKIKKTLGAVIKFKAISNFLGKGLILALLNSQAEANERLYETIGERLGLMQSVAAYKFRNNLPIQSSEREDEVINLAILAGLSQRITKDSLRKVFQTQIEAAKEIQFCWFKKFSKTKSLPKTSNLLQVIRPKIEILGKKIVEQIPAQVSNYESFVAHLNIECLSDESKLRIFSALQEVAFYPNPLEQVRKSRFLRVGTTGDYAPFSVESLHTGELEGIDIDLAKSLANYLEVNLVFVKTSWPDLMDDLTKLKYDIAMSGVSITEERSKKAYFSDPYHVGGKIPISLCSKAALFSSLEKIDKQGVNLIVNPGGTNEKFLDQNIKYATKILHEDNKTIFSRINDGHADLMITDKIEVFLQIKENPALCATMKEPLNYQEKGFMMAKDRAFKGIVNDWLKAVIASGELIKKFDLHIQRD